MSLTILLAVMLVSMLMAALFASLLHPCVMLCTVPCAVTGAVITLWLTDTHVRMPVHIGAILLVGLAVQNGMVMVDSINQRRQRGLGPLEATREGAVTRLRPTLTTTLALMLMALGLGDGGEVWAPLGRVVGGG